ncbi:protein canopy 4-like [Acropora muricata]|uniref:protein canopy 4-like n=1 Tax=Acropora millepora TaxID=45264 RepID=UPI001CF5131F|nr:protein canopy 4-like [Acropora millepora]
MDSTTMLIILFSVYLFIISPLVTCEVETITVGSDSKTKRKNPYITKFHDEASLRPTKCQVCRLLVTEFLEQMKKTDHKEDIPRGYVLEDLEDHDKNIHYERSELRLMDVLDSLCQRMKLYQARAGPDFPYIKGAKSQLREVMDDLTQRSKVKLNYELPDEVVEDYTYEMGRLKFKCIHLLEQHEEDLTQWYFSDQNENLMSWLCVERVLDENERDCLNASTEMPADYHSFLQEDNTTETIQPTEENKWEL